MYRYRDQARAPPLPPWHDHRQVEAVGAFGDWVPSVRPPNLVRGVVNLARQAKRLALPALVLSAGIPAASAAEASEVARPVHPADAVAAPSQFYVSLVNQAADLASGAAVTIGSISAASSAMDMYNPTPLFDSSSAVVTTVVAVSVKAIAAVAETFLAQTRQAIANLTHDQLEPVVAATEGGPSPIQEVYVLLGVEGGITAPNGFVNAVVIRESPEASARQLSTIVVPGTGEQIVAGGVMVASSVGAGLCLFMANPLCAFKMGMIAGTSATVLLGHYYGADYVMNFLGSEEAIRRYAEVSEELRKHGAGGAVKSEKMKIAARYLYLRERVFTMHKMLRATTELWRRDYQGRVRAAIEAGTILRRETTMEGNNQYAFSVGLFLMGKPSLSYEEDTPLMFVLGFVDEGFLQVYFSRAPNPITQPPTWLGYLLPGARTQFARVLPPVSEPAAVQQALGLPSPEPASGSSWIPLPDLTRLFNRANPNPAPTTLLLPSTTADAPPPPAVESVPPPPPPGAVQTSPPPPSETWQAQWEAERERRKENLERYFEYQSTQTANGRKEVKLAPTEFSLSVTLSTVFESFDETTQKLLLQSIQRWLPWVAAGLGAALAVGTGVHYARKRVFTPATASKLEQDLRAARTSEERVRVYQRAIAEEHAIDIHAPADAPAPAAAPAPAPAPAPTSVDSFAPHPFSFPSYAQSPGLSSATSVSAFPQATPASASSAATPPLFDSNPVARGLLPPGLALFEDNGGVHAYGWNFAPDLAASTVATTVVAPTLRADSVASGAASHGSASSVVSGPALAPAPVPTLPAPTPVPVPVPVPAPAPAQTLEGRAPAPPAPSAPAPSAPQANPRPKRRNKAQTSSSSSVATQPPTPVSLYPSLTRHDQEGVRALAAAMVLLL